MSAFVRRMPNPIHQDELPAGDERGVNQLARAIFTRAMGQVLIWEPKQLPDRRLLRLAEESFRAADAFAATALRRYRKREREARSAQLKHERELKGLAAKRRQKRRGKKKGGR